MYEIRIKKSAKKDLDALDDRTYSRIDRNIQRLRNNPFPKGVKKLRGGETGIESEKENTGCFMRLTRRIKLLLSIGLS